MFPFGSGKTETFKDEFSKMCDEGISIGNSFEPAKVSGISNIIVGGLGGSGVCGDLLLDAASLEVPIIVVKDYNMPKFANGKSLVFCISYSGNTEETLSQFMQAKGMGCNIISITSGGKLKEWSDRMGTQCIVVPGGKNPRDALPIMMFPLLIALQKLGFGEYDRDFADVKEAISKADLRKLDELASKIKNSRLAIYGTASNMGSLRRMKNEFNENAKMAVMYDYFPEINHNEMNGYQRTGLSKNVDVIFLRDSHESEEMTARIETTKDILENYVNSISEIWAIGDSRLARMMSLVFMGSYMTGKIASLVGIDREKVPFVDRLKDSLKARLNTVEKLERKVDGQGQAQPVPESHEATEL